MDKSSSSSSDDSLSFASLVLTPVVVQAGLTVLAFHCVFYVLFAYILPKGPWTACPGFTAHQAICLPLMIYLTYEGFVAWFWDNSNVQDDAVVHILEIQERGYYIGQVVLGMMLFWDIPVGLVTPALQDLLMLFHHLGLALISGVVVGVFSGGKPVGSYYASFFFGVVEFSSIFLTLVDIFHPKHKEWYEYLHSNEDSQFTQTLQSMNELCRVLFAVAFLAVRTLYFPYVQIVGAIPDFTHVASLPEEEREGVASGILYGVCLFATLFSALQIYWGFLVARQVVKALGIGGASSQKKKEKSE